MNIKKSTLNKKKFLKSSYGKMASCLFVILELKKLGIRLVKKCFSLTLPPKKRTGAKQAKFQFIFRFYSSFPVYM